jgi:hypothetical protein
MSNAAGPLVKISFDNESFQLPNDNDINYWPGGFVPTDALANIKGATKKVEFMPGKITGLNTRLAKSGDVRRLFNALTKTATENVVFVGEFANGDKVTASVFAVVDADSYFSNAEAKGTFDVCASDDSNGVFQDLP